MPLIFQATFAKSFTIESITSSYFPFKLMAMFVPFEQASLAVLEWSIPYVHTLGGVRGAILYYRALSIV